MALGIDSFEQMVGTTLVLLLALYGSVFDPPNSGYLRWAAALVAILAGSWLVILMIVAGSPARG